MSGDRCRRALELAGIVAWVVPVLLVLSLVDRVRGGAGAVGPTAVGGKGARRG